MSKKIVAELARRIKRTSLRETARNLGISAPYLCDIMKGRRGLGQKILKAISEGR